MPTIPCLDAALADPPKAKRDRERVMTLGAAYAVRKFGDTDAARDYLTEYKERLGFTNGIDVGQFFDASAKHEHKYQCHLKVQRTRCDIVTCRACEHGVSAENGELTLHVTNPRKVAANPDPYFLFDINGKRARFKSGATAVSTHVRSRGVFNTGLRMA